MKKIVFILVVLILAGAGYWGYTTYSPGAPQIQLVTNEVTRGDIVRTIDATGRLEAVTTVQVGSQVSGSISALYADFNSQVTARADRG